MGMSGDGGGEIYEAVERGRKKKVTRHLPNTTGSFRMSAVVVASRLVLNTGVT
jgi:hypothetical protein